MTDKILILKDRVLEDKKSLRDTLEEIQGSLGRIEQVLYDQLINQDFFMSGDQGKRNAHTTTGSPLTKNDVKK